MSNLMMNYLKMDSRNHHNLYLKTTRHINEEEASSHDVDDLIAEANDSEEEFIPDGDIYDEYIGN